MGKYLVRVQLVEWFEITVDAPSAEDAFGEAEAMLPRQIRARGKQFNEETGLADPHHVCALSVLAVLPAPDTASAVQSVTSAPESSARLRRGPGGPMTTRATWTHRRSDS